MLASNGNHCVDILKVDVDGVEDTLLRSTRWEELCVGMFVFEIHHGPLIEAFETQPQPEHGRHGAPGKYTVARALIACSGSRGWVYALCERARLRTLPRPA